MPQACLNPYGCEWSIGYVWRSMDWLRRLDVVVLVVMLAYILAVVTRVFYRCSLARDLRGIDCAGRRRLAVDLSLQARSLKSIASTAPYLGLLGTCFGILNAPGIGSGIGMEKNTALVLMASGTAAALITTAVGIFVAVPATCSYNYLCTRIDLLESEAAGEAPTCPGPQTPPKTELTKRFSLPAFAIIAAPALAILVAVWMPYFAPRRPTGFAVDLAPATCDYDRTERLIVVRINNAGKVFLNLEQEDWNSLASRLAEIYSMRVHRVLYLSADNGVPFQTVADAIDLAQNSTSSAPLDITIRLITPAAMNVSCPDKVVISSNPRASR